MATANEFERAFDDHIKEQITFLEKVASQQPSDDPKTEKERCEAKYLVPALKRLLRGEI